MYVVVLAGDFDGVGLVFAHVSIEDEHVVDVDELLGLFDGDIGFRGEECDGGEGDGDRGGNG